MDLTSSDNLQNFYYLVFQSYPAKDKVYFWVDGDKSKKVMKTQRFISLLDKVDSLKNMLYEAISTTSYFMYDNINSQIFKLDPKMEFNNFQYPLGKVFQKLRGGQAHEYEKDIEKPSLENHLNSLGFEAPDENKIKNLQVALLKRKEK
jgi:hypothetical protein